MSKASLFLRSGCGTGNSLRAGAVQLLETSASSVSSCGATVGCSAEAMASRGECRPSAAANEHHRGGALWDPRNASPSKVITASGGHACAFAMASLPPRTTEKVSSYIKSRQSYSELG